MNAIRTEEMSKSYFNITYYTSKVHRILTNKNAVDVKTIFNISSIIRFKHNNNNHLELHF